MLPFRVFDKENKQMWIVLNFHPNDSQGSYLVAKEDDEDDGQLSIVSAEQLAKFRLVDFLDESDLHE